MKRPDEDIRKELEELSPHLLKMKEQGDGFRLPEDYFQRMQKEVLEKVQGTSQITSAKKIGWLDRLFEPLQFLFLPRWALGLATIVLVVTLGAIWLYQSQPVAGSELSGELAKLDPESLNAYIQANFHEFDTETLLEFASNQENQPNFENLTPEELDQYLDEAIQEMDAEALKELL
jgi:hypothetical protein